MNRFQEIYINLDCNGEVPDSQKEKTIYDVLGNIKENIIVHFPTKNETYQVTENDCDMPNGKISVRVLSRNIPLWTIREYEIEYI